MERTKLSSMNNSFAFIGHAIGITQLFNFLGAKSRSLKDLENEKLKEALARLGPHRSATIKNFQSASGHSIDFHIIIVPFLLDQFVTLPEEDVLSKILEAIEYGHKRGAKLASLGGFTSVVGNEGEFLSKKASIPITSGNTYTACLAIDGVLKAAQLMEIDLPASTAAIIGATGDIGSICTKVLANEVKKINIAARKEKKLYEFAENLKQSKECQVEVFKYPQDAVKEADIVLTVASATTTVINTEGLKSGAVVCDVAYPANIAREIAKKRDDILVFEGGLAKPPATNGIVDKREWKDNLPSGCIFGCMAEGIVLTLAGKFENYSLGRGNITEEKINEIRTIAKDLGFGVSDFYCGEKLFTEKDINNIKEIAKKRRTIEK